MPSGTAITVFLWIIPVVLIPCVILALYFSRFKPLSERSVRLSLVSVITGNVINFMFGLKIPCYLIVVLRQLFIPAVFVPVFLSAYLYIRKRRLMDAVTTTHRTKNGSVLYGQVEIENTSPGLNEERLLEVERIRRQSSKYSLLKLVSQAMLPHAAALVHFAITRDSFWSSQPVTSLEGDGDSHCATSTVERVVIVAMVLAHITLGIKTMSQIKGTFDQFGIYTDISRKYLLAGASLVLYIITTSFVSWIGYYVIRVALLLSAVLQCAWPSYETWNGLEGRDKRVHSGGRPTITSGIHSKFSTPNFGLDIILDSPMAMDSFQAHLKEEFSMENLSFVVAVNHFKAADYPPNIEPPAFPGRPVAGSDGSLKGSAPASGSVSASGSSRSVSTSSGTSSRFSMMVKSGSTRSILSSNKEAGKSRAKGKRSTTMGIPAAQSSLLGGRFGSPKQFGGRPSVIRSRADSDSFRQSEGGSVLSFTGSRKYGDAGGETKDKDNEEKEKKGETEEDGDSHMNIISITNIKPTTAAVLAQDRHTTTSLLGPPTGSGDSPVSPSVSAPPASSASFSAPLPDPDPDPDPDAGSGSGSSSSSGSGLTLVKPLQQPPGVSRSPRGSSSNAIKLLSLTRSNSNNNHNSSTRSLVIGTSDGVSGGEWSPDGTGRGFGGGAVSDSNFSPKSNSSSNSNFNPNSSSNPNPKPTTRRRSVNRRGSTHRNSLGSLGAFNFKEMIASYRRDSGRKYSSKRGTIGRGGSREYGSGGGSNDGGGGEGGEGGGGAEGQETSDFER